MNKRIKLSPTVRVHIVDDDTVQVFGRRMSDEQKNDLKNELNQTKRRLKYNIKFQSLEDFAKKHDYEYEGVPKHLLDLKDYLKRKKNDTFETENKTRFNFYWNNLYPHQQHAVKKIVTYFKGRALLADDMGLGKTHQAIALILYYQHEGPILIVCPSYLCLHWKNALGGIEATIVSYDMLPKHKQKSYNMLVCDESHYVKNRKAKRTIAVKNIKSRRALFLTGTPALNRPIELFSQLQIIRKEFVKNYSFFAKRYCDGKISRFGYDDRGHSCDEELHWLLKKVYMVRRLKRDIINLPNKTRHAIMLDVEDLEELPSKLEEWKTMTNLQDIKTIMSEMFRITARVKRKAIQQWIKNISEPFLFFAYHRSTLDALEEVCENYIRIDGSTPTKERQQLVDEFQQGQKKIALLSLMAAGTGLTLTKASTVIFGELYWVPGVMVQAEDRVHRLGQKNKVNIYHLIGNGTLDTYIYTKLIQKLKMLDAVVDNRNDRSLKGK